MPRYVNNLLIILSTNLKQTFISIFQARNPQPSVLMRCWLQELILHKFNLEKKDTDNPKEHFIGDLKELVLPASSLLDPANGLIEAPHDDRFQIAHRIDRFAQMVQDVSELSCEVGEDLIKTALLRIHTSSHHEPTSDAANALPYCAGLGWPAARSMYMKLGGFS